MSSRLAGKGACARRVRVSNIRLWPPPRTDIGAAKHRRPVLRGCMMIKGTSQRWLTQCVVAIVTGIIVGASSASALGATRSEPVKPASNWRFQPDGADGCSMVAGYRPDQGDPSQAIFGQSFTILRSQPDQVIFALSTDSRGDGNDSDPDASHGITTIQMFLNFRDGPTFDLPT